MCRRGVCTAGCGTPPPPRVAGVTASPPPEACWGVSPERMYRCGCGRTSPLDIRRGKRIGLSRCVWTRALSVAIDVGAPVKSAYAPENATALGHNHRLAHSVASDSPVATFARVPAGVNATVLFAVLTTSSTFAQVVEILCCIKPCNGRPGVPRRRSSLDGAGDSDITLPDLTVYSMVCVRRVRAERQQVWWRRK